MEKTSLYADVVKEQMASLPSECHTSEKTPGSSTCRPDTMTISSRVFLC